MAVANPSAVVALGLTATSTRLLALRQCVDRNVMKVAAQLECVP
jgi:hypothetical protein